MKFVWKVILVLLLGIAPTSLASTHSQAKTYEVMIHKKVVNIRQGPGLSYSILKQAKQGDVYKVLAKEGEWLKIKMDGQEGWIAEWLVDEKSNPKMEESSYGKVTVRSLRVRSGPGIHFQTIDSLAKNEKVKILEINGNWLHITSSKIKGWVSAEFVALSKPETNSMSKSEQTMYDGRVIVESLNVRNKPSLEADIIGELKKDEVITIVSEDGDWVQFDYKGTKGFIHRNFIELLKSGHKREHISPDLENKESQKGNAVTLQVTSLNVRNEPSFSGRIIGKVKKGDSFIILNEKNNWVQFSYTSKQKGWIPSWYISQNEESKQKHSHGKLTDATSIILYDGTVLRAKPDAYSTIVKRTNEGDRYKITAIQGDWYELELEKGKRAYVAGWLVETHGDVPQIENRGIEKYFSGKTIVIDPGHGGRDQGATGTKGSLEKTLTLRTAKLLNDKIRAAGGKTIMTRTGDTYVTLLTRVALSNARNADAFISIHYDSTIDPNVNGITTYYYHDYQKPLASSIHSFLIEETSLSDRGTRIGDYRVIRENHSPSVLLELGYMSNPNEEMTIVSEAYQDTVTEAIFKGLTEYFSKN
ncbi:SH3 domain-containing protein [Peribacillus tepidiphilus]|uniref:SH3 domain-containing protein n=1 Tax=Peribacillus tepidiphilus TaxID=2652445 RepID=UPI0035B5610F